MTTLTVQFSDATDAVIVSYFGSPQDPDEFANLGTVDTSDPRWKVFYDACLPLIQAAMPAPD